jgi:2'-5' RNA ligase
MSKFLSRDLDVSWNSVSCILFARSSHRLTTEREVIRPSEEYRGLVTEMESNFYVHVTVHRDKFPYNKTNWVH